MRILYVLPGFGIAGGIRIAIEHCNRLLDRGHEVVMTGTDMGMFCSWLDFKAPIMHPLEAEREEWEVVVATEASTWHWVARPEILADRKYGFCQMKEQLFYRPSNMERVEAFFKMPLIPITISNWLKEWLESFHEKVYLIPNGVNFDTFYPEPFDPDILPVFAPIILIEGHELSDDPGLEYIPAKNTRHAHRVVDVLREEGYDVRKWGFSQDQEEGDRWQWDQFWLRPDQDTIRRIYSTAGESGGLLLKTTRYEGRNCTVVEAMACRCPVVATNCGGIDDLLHGYTCLLSTYGDIDRLVENSKAILSDMTDRQRMIEYAFKYVRESLDWDNIIPVLETILEGKGGTK